MIRTSLFLVAALCLGLSVTLFLLREQLAARARRPVRVAAPIRGDAA
jgi:hypothetical protein